MPDLTFRELQEQQQAWHKYNFGEVPAYQPILGAVEELGELATSILNLMQAVGKIGHAYLKREQGIRGTAEQHEADAKDAVADIIVFLTHFCTANGWDMQEVVQGVWEQVRQRDFTKNSLNGAT